MARPAGVVGSSAKSCALPLIKFGEVRWQVQVPFLIAMRPIRPDSIEALVTRGVVAKSMLPSLKLRILKDVGVDPVNQLEPQKLPIGCMRPRKCC